MRHFFGIALIVWGLIAQPLMQPVPIKMDAADARTMMVSGTSPTPHAEGHDLHHHHHSEIAHAGQQVEMTSDAPCHSKSDKEPSKPCNHCKSANCNADCMNAGHCSSSCTTTGGSLLAQLFTIPSPNLNKLAQLCTNEALTFGPPSRIYHPPRHA